MSNDSLPDQIIPVLPGWLIDSVVSKKPVVKEIKDYSIAFYERLYGSLNIASDTSKPNANVTPLNLTTQVSQPTQLNLTLVKEQSGFSDDRTFRVWGQASIGDQSFQVVQGEATPKPFLGFYSSAVLFSYTLLLRPITGELNPTLVSPLGLSSQPVQYASEQLYVLYAEIVASSSFNPFTQNSNLRTLHVQFFTASSSSSPPADDTNNQLPPKRGILPQLTGFSSSISSSTSTSSTASVPVKLERTLSGEVSAKPIQYIFDSVLGIQTSQWTNLTAALSWLVLFLGWAVSSIFSAVAHGITSGWTASSGHIHGKVYKNWDGGVRVPLADNKDYVEPETIDELKLVIANAVKAHASVRIIGSGHSFNQSILKPADLPSQSTTADTAVVTGPPRLLVSLNKLNRVLSLDLHHKVIDIEGGVQLSQLAGALHDHGLTIPNHGVSLIETVAGAISTGTHGTSGKWVWHDGRLDANQGTAAFLKSVLEVELIDEQGRFQIVTDPKQIVQLGLAGVIVRVKFQAVDIFYLQKSQFFLTTDQIFPSLITYLQEYRLVEIRGAAGSRNASLYTYSLLPNINSAEQTPNLVRRFPFSYLFNIVSYRSPAFFYRWFYELVTKASNLAPFRDVNTWVTTEDFANPQTQTEWAIPFDKAQEGLKRLFDVLSKREYSGLNGEFHLRFDLPSQAWVSPASDRHTIYIKLSYFRSNPAEKVKAVFGHLQDELLKSDVAARPVWSTEFYPDSQPPLDPKYFDSVYPNKPQFEKFITQSSPSGLFSVNPFSLQTGLVKRTARR